MNRVISGAIALVFVAALAACTDSGPSEQPPGDEPGSPSAEGTPGDDILQLAEAQFNVGPAEIVIGPTTTADSFINAVQVGDKVRAYVGRGDTYLLEGSDVTDLAPTGQQVIQRGGREDFDRCGAWINAVVRDDRDPELLRAWYHAEADCAYAEHQTRKSVAYAESRDGGVTFTKPGYPDNQVLRSPTDVVEGQRTGRGNTTIVRRGKYFYMYYQEVLPDFSIVTSVARAPVASGGVPGTWRNYTEDTAGKGTWTADALDGPAATLDVKVGASSASVHTSSDEVMLVRQNGPRGGIVMQTSEDGIHFTQLREPLVPYLDSQIREGWGVVDDKQIFGYVSVMATDGSRAWDDTFYLFHMYVFPGDDLHDGRYLVRREVQVTEAPANGPWSTVALTSYVGATGDRYATSAPEKPSARADGGVAQLLAADDAGRRALFECRSAAGKDRFVSASCGVTPIEERLVGYAFTEEQAGTVRLYRCETPAGDQYPSLDGECDGGRTVTELGFVYPPDE